MSFRPTLRVALSLSLWLATPAAVHALTDVDAVHREPLVVGEVVVLESAILAEQRPLTIQVPPHDPPGTPRDVIIVLDAENHGYHISGIVDFLSHRYVERMEPAIVVGVLNTDRLRDTTPTPTAKYPEAGGVREFVRFLHEELTPWLDSNYATTGRRMLVGHSGSGITVMYALIDTPDTFDTLVCVDPSLDWDDGVFFEHAKESLNKRSKHDLRLYLSSYREKEVINTLVDFLEKRAPRKLAWTLTEYEGETHASMVHRVLLDALQSHGKEQLER